MLAARPDKPQLHYLMGYLRQQQKRAAEAAEYFRKAVALDPLYLNAWDKLADLEQQLSFTPAQRDELALKLLELDPARRHATPNLSRVTDLAALWHGLQVSARALADLPPATDLWQLKASAAQVQEGDSYFNTETPPGGSFGAVLSEYRFVQALQGYLAALNAPPEEN
jgi:tetratricopeptide (TPR) repeat protein